MKTLLEQMRQEIGERALDIRQVSPLALAYVGDTVFDLYVRTQLVLTKEEAPKLMHTDAVHFVKASAQAQMAKYLLDSLNEKETAVLKRGRNQKSLSVPKNALLLDYKWATGFEALLGYLYVTGQSERLDELMHRATEWFTEKENVQ
mgnify:CR=1 FL=1